MDEADRIAQTEQAPHVHHIEEQAVVYLKLNDTGDGWELDHGLCDEYEPLQGYEAGAINDACEDCPDEDQCETIREAANEIDGPTLPELFEMLAKHYGEPRV